MTRGARARIDLSALRYNLERARRAAGDARVLAVVKADAYGHGALRVARALGAADGFGVARIEEGLQLREAGVTKPVVLLSGVVSREDFREAAARALGVVVHHPAQIDTLEALTPAPAIDVWLKVDSGMHRIGIPPGEAVAAWRRLARTAAVAGPPKLMTHLACADERADPATGAQLARFMPVVEATGAEWSAANSAGLLGWPESRGSWVRPGIMLYGISPFVGGRGTELDLRPVMTLETHLIAVNRVPRGESIGYGATWTCPRDMLVGVAAIGYGDGYPRHAPSGTPVLVNGRRTRLLGRVSMDMIVVDLCDQPEARPGDPVVLWGRGLAAEEIAEHVGTIAYELVTRVSPRVAVEEEADAR
ncbi:MAG: alanine racemase [Gammaproteobacteria bacterium]|nr:alanine racemase [Gammaproteobacteria bacterium]